MMPHATVAAPGAATAHLSTTKRRQEPAMLKDSHYPDRPVRRIARAHLPCLCMAATVGLAALMAGGCSGGSGNSSSGATNAPAGSATDQTFGPMVTRAVGTAQPPVSASAGNTTVIGVAGATFGTVTQVDTSPKSLADTKISFEREGVVYTINPDGTALKPITISVDGLFVFGGPVWSPDGTRMAFAASTQPGPPQDIYVMNADGTGVKNLTNTASAAEFSLTWSPDGKKIAYRRFDSDPNNGQIYVMNAADGSGQMRLTDGTGNYIGPNWSPDGSQIAFEGYAPGVANDQIYVMNANGTNQTRLGNNTSFDAGPSWSPDGTKIAFESDRVAPNITIWTMNPDGSGAKQVTFAADGDPNPGNDLVPTWAPDGSALAFLSTRGGPPNTKLFVGTFSAQDGTLTGIHQIMYHAGSPSWSTYLPRTPKKLVGSGGIMASSAAGFLFSQASSSGSRSQVASVVTFDTSLTTNRVNARVDKLSDVNTAAAVFSVTDGDGTLNNLRYINSVDGKVIQAVGTSAVPTAAGILVSFDGTDGSVATVFPYNATKAAGSASMKPVKEGDALVFRGEFAAVWNGKGENAAPSGAHLVKIDAKTGRLIEAQ
jgi:Tol biopolymer transport system component